MINISSDSIATQTSKIHQSFINMVILEWMNGRLTMIWLTTLPNSHLCRVGLKENLATDVFIEWTFTHPTSYKPNILMYLVSLNIAFEAEYGLHSVLHVFTRSLFFFCFFLTNSVKQSRIIGCNAGNSFPRCLSVSKMTSWLCQSLT